MKKRFQVIALILISLFVLNACDDPQQSNLEASVEVRKVMAQRKQAIESGDLDLYKSLILPEYNDGKSNHQEQVAYMKSLFERYKNIAFTYQKSKVDITMNSARMVGKISYKPEGSEKAAWDHETTLFRRVDGKWYISGGVNLGIL